MKETNTPREPLIFLRKYSKLFGNKQKHKIFLSLPKKSLFTNRDIADYYNQTFQHYQFWWKMDRALAVHYGLWHPETRNFIDALENTNVALAKLAEIPVGSRVLDAGCGVGGSAFFLAKTLECRVSGITLSEKQLAYAIDQNAKKNLGHLVDFSLQDYTQTCFPDESFDVVWAIESLTSSPHKNKFAQEAGRILKPGGTLVLADYFRRPETSDPKGWMELWRLSWSLAPILELADFVNEIQLAGFSLQKNIDVTTNIMPTAKRMYLASLLGALPSFIYNNLFKTSRFAKNHYKSGYYQFKALQQQLWNYRLLSFRKK